MPWGNLIKYMVFIITTTTPPSKRETNCQNLSQSEGSLCLFPASLYSPTLAETQTYTKRQINKQKMPFYIQERNGVLDNICLLLVKHVNAEDCRVTHASPSLQHRALSKMCSYLSEKSSMQWLSNLYRSVWNIE